MGRRGPVPTPTAKLRLLPGGEAPAPVIPGEIPPCPVWLMDNGREQWERVLADAKVRALLGAFDPHLLGIYCQTLADYIEQSTIAAEEGWLVPGDRGIRVKNPRAQIVRELRSSVLKLAKELGLTPTEKAKAAGGERAHVEDPLGDFANEKDEPADVAGA